MADVKTDKEPSIEEILESIRQIISEDGDTPADKPVETVLSAPVEPPMPAFKPDPEPVPPPQKFQEEVIDLTEKVDTFKSDLDLSAQPEEKFSSDLDLSAGLLSDASASASADAMAKLLAGNVAVERDVPGRVGNVTLEDMARELMRPLIKTWLDQNLPRIIEKMVQKEIDKVSRRALGRE